MPESGTKGACVTAFSATLIVAAVLLVWLSGCLRANAPNPPYPPSALIEGITWDFPNMVRAAPGSDLWPVTWGPDNNVYVAWGDGGGFGGTDREGRVSMGFARIKGTPVNLETANVNGGAHPEHPPHWKCENCGKPETILFVNGTLYAWVNMQNREPPDMVLWWSSDMGESWQSANWHFSGGGAFEPRGFLNFGPDYANARDNYVYSYGCDRSNNSLLLLARTPRDRLTDRTAYEFYAGTDTRHNPVWKADVSARGAVFSDPNGVASIAAIYSSALSRYLLSTHHSGDYAGRLGIFDAPQPWGPWTTIAYYDDWNGLGSLYGGMPHSFPGKWISPDGLRMYAIFSGTGEWDSFNLLGASLRLRKQDAPQAD